MIYQQDYSDLKILNMLLKKYIKERGELDNKIYKVKEIANR